MEAISVISFTSVFLTLLYAFVLAVFIVGWRKLKPFQPKGDPGRTKVSVIVAARNEEDNIALTLTDLIAQDYNKFLTEIIIVDDHSTDRTAEIIRSFSDRGVKLIVLDEDQALNSYKKKAIQTAIAGASGDLIVTTDADCRMGPSWLSTIVSFYETGNYKMISSPVAYFEEKSFFERAQSLEFLFLIGLGASAIGNKRPSTCNGANLSYEKKAFYEVGGFKGIDDLASGDDELLLHKMAAAFDGQIGFLKSRQAIVYTHAKPDLGAFIQQRKRWASKSTRYKDKSIVFLGVAIWLFNVTIVINLILGLGSVFFLKLAAIQLLTKMLMEFIFLARVTAFAKRRELLRLLPVLNFLHIIYMIYIGVAGNSGKYNWKDRMVK